MGYDETGLVWNPRISAAFPYDIPGSIRLDTIQDSNNPTIIAAGPSNIYSSPVPLLSEVNSGSGINQIIAYLIRRGQLFLNTYAPGGTSFINTNAISVGQLTYLNPNVKVKASDITKIQTYINSLRSFEQWTNAYSFPSVSGLIKGSDIANLRKSLSIRGTMTISPYFQVNSKFPTNWGRYTFFDDVYPNSHRSGSELNNVRSSGSNIFNAGGPIQGIGKSCVLAGSSTAMYRSRAYYQFPILSFISAINSVTLSTEIVGINNSLDSTWSFIIASSNTDDSTMVMTPAFGGFSWNTNNQISTFSNSSLSNFTPVISNFSASQISQIVARAGGRYCLIAYQDLERNGGGNINNGAKIGQQSGCDVHDFLLLNGHTLVPGNTSFVMDFGP